MTTEFLGAQQGLSAARETDDAIALSFRTGAESELGREWLLTPPDDGAYRITNRAIGSGLSLDVVNDGVFDQVALAPSDNVSGRSG